MKCPECNCESLYTIDSRPHGKIIKRRKKCGVCGYKFNTYESNMYLDNNCFYIIKQALRQYKDNNKNIPDCDKKIIDKMMRDLA